MYCVQFCVPSPSNLGTAYNISNSCRLCYEHSLHLLSRLLFTAPRALPKPAQFSPSFQGSPFFLLLFFAIAMPSPRSSGTASDLKVTPPLSLSPPPSLSGLSRSTPDVVRAVSAKQGKKDPTTGGSSCSSGGCNSASAAEKTAAVPAFLNARPHRVAGTAAAPAAGRSKQPPLVFSAGGLLLLVVLAFGMFACQRIVVQPGLFNLPTQAEFLVLSKSNNLGDYPLSSASTVPLEVVVPAGASCAAVSESASVLVVNSPPPTRPPPPEANSAPSMAKDCKAGVVASEEDGLVQTGAATTGGGVHFPVGETEESVANFSVVSGSTSYYHSMTHPLGQLPSTGSNTSNWFPNRHNTLSQPTSVKQPTAPDRHGSHDDEPGEEGAGSEKGGGAAFKEEEQYGRKDEKNGEIPPLHRANAGPAGTGKNETTNLTEAFAFSGDVLNCSSDREFLATPDELHHQPHAPDQGHDTVGPSGAGPWTSYSGPWTSAALDAGVVATGGDGDAAQRSSPDCSFFAVDLPCSLLDCLRHQGEIPPLHRVNAGPAGTGKNETTNLTEAFAFSGDVLNCSSDRELFPSVISQQILCMQQNIVQNLKDGLENRNPLKPSCRVFNTMDPGSGVDVPYMDHGNLQQAIEVTKMQPKIETEESVANFSVVSGSTSYHSMTHPLGQLPNTGSNTSNCFPNRHNTLSQLTSVKQPSSDVLEDTEEENRSSTLFKLFGVHRQLDLQFTSHAILINLSGGRAKSGDDGGEGSGEECDDLSGRREGMGADVARDGGVGQNYSGTDNQGGRRTRGNKGTWCGGQEGRTRARGRFLLANPFKLLIAFLQHYPSLLSIRGSLHRR